MTYSITFSDGTKLTGLGLNGNNFISRTEITPETFKGKLTKITVAQEAGNTEPDNFGVCGEHTNMALAAIQKQANGDYWFVLYQLSKDDLRDIEVNARLDYIEMMEDLA